MESGLKQIKEIYPTQIQKDFVDYLFTDGELNISKTAEKFGLSNSVFHKWMQHDNFRNYYAPRAKIHFFTMTPDAINGIGYNINQFDNLPVKQKASEFTLEVAGVHNPKQAEIKAQININIEDRESRIKNLKRIIMENEPEIETLSTIPGTVEGTPGPVDTVPPALPGKEKQI